ncbi:MAG TPA: hypothetical protein VGG21_05060 [Acidimicrobiales bacterium]|jgi:hypothetical protein
MITQTNLIDDLESEFALADLKWSGGSLVDGDAVGGADDDDEEDTDDMGGEDADDPETMGGDN